MDFLGNPTNADLAEMLFAVGERMDGTDTTVLLTLDPCTGLGTEVGAVGGLDVVSQDISFQVSDGTLFGASRDDLVTYDTTTGAEAFIGTITGAGQSGYGLASDPADDTLYVAVTEFEFCTFSNLLTVDTATGAKIVEIPLTYPNPPLDNPCVRINSMDFNPDTGTLFGAVNNGGGGGGGGGGSVPENHLGTVNTATGVVTILGQTQGGLDAIALLGPGYSVSGSPASQSITKGSSTTFTINIDPVSSSWDTAVNLTCSTRTGTTCSFSPTSVTPGVSTASSTMTVTTAGLATVGPPAPLGGSPWKTPPISLYGLALVGMALLMLTGVKVFKPTGWTRRLVQYSAMMLLFARVLAGCGGDSPPPPVNFNVTITGSSGSVVRTATVAVTAN